jgi:hypothetical protein
MSLTDLNRAIITNLYKILFLWFVSFALGWLLSHPIPIPPSPKDKGEGGMGMGWERERERGRDKGFLL